MYLYSTETVHPEVGGQIYQMTTLSLGSFKHVGSDGPDAERAPTVVTVYLLKAPDAYA